MSLVFDVQAQKRERAKAVHSSDFSPSYTHSVLSHEALLESRVFKDIRHKCIT